MVDPRDSYAEAFIPFELNQHNEPFFDGGKSNPISGKSENNNNKQECRRWQNESRFLQRHLHQRVEQRELQNNQPLAK